MDPVTIQHAYTGLKFAIETLRTIVGTKAQIAADGKIADALDHLGKVQDTMFELRNTLADLQAQNMELMAKLRDQDGWETVANKYTLAQAPGGAMVYATQGPPLHYACPTCYASKKIIPLQPAGGDSIAHQCPQCNAFYSVREHKPRKNVHVPAERGGGPLSWMGN